MPLEDTIPMKIDGANGIVVMRTNKGERLPRSWQDFPIWRPLENTGVSSETIGKGIAAWLYPFLPVRFRPSQASSFYYFFIEQCRHRTFPI
jgi:hypothetical protein